MSRSPLTALSALSAGLLLALSAPAWAQSHAGHASHATTPTPTDAPPADDGNVDHLLQQRTLHRREITQRCKHHRTARQYQPGNRTLPGNIARTPRDPAGERKARQIIGQ